MSKEEAKSKKRKLTADEIVKPKKAKTSEAPEIKCEPTWEEHVLLSEQSHIDPRVSQNVIKLFEEGNTIPFIARYRKNVTGNMTPEQLRDVKEMYDEICNLKAKIRSVVRNLEKNGKVGVQREILSCRTLEELEYVYAPYKPESKRTLAERAKALGLEKPAMNILSNCCKENLSSYIQKDKEGLNRKEDVEKGVVHIIASVVSRDADLLVLLRELRNNSYCVIETKKAATKKNSTKDPSTGKNVDESKYSNYFDFKTTSRNVKPHQVLAINRGEHLKVLTVKIHIPEFFHAKYINFCNDKWLKLGAFEFERQKILKEAFEDAYSRLVQPLIVREVRSTLKQMAEKASYEIFSKNLKQLLLAAPLKGKMILGIDPGFANGCKLAVISETGTLLDHDVIYPLRNRSNEAREVLIRFVKEYGCDLIALGNGTACRETETWLTDLIRSKAFAPLDVSYTIVNEDGASIYSCSAEAKKEFPTLDTNVVSAVSLARRIQEPLAELVKIEPKHLGVGMYQHDLKQKQLDEALNEVVSECVSFVGVDLNTASRCLLKHIAGLTDKRATQIVEFREKNGPFTSRQQLMDVKGIGAKVFEQCAGFLRVEPNSEVEEFYSRKETTKLDCTYIHPESYNVAKALIKKMCLKAQDVGTASFMARVDAFKSKASVKDLALELKSPEETIDLILDSLRKPLSYDLRSECNIRPLFKQGITKISDLGIGTTLTGRVNNVTSFGCFVDIGVGVNGLIHVGGLKGVDLQIGDRVDVKVRNVEVERKRISLVLVSKL